MDETRARPGLPGDRSQAAAEKLRALRERANEALEGHRTRLGEIESQLSGRVRQLAEEFGATLGAATEAASMSHEEELAALRKQVDDSNAKHEIFVAQLHAAQRQLSELESQPCSSCQHASQQLAAAEEDVRRLRDELETSTRVHEEDRGRHEKFVEQLAAARQAITVLQHAAGETSNELRSDLEDLRASKAVVEDELSAARRDLAALHDECELATSRVDQLEAELAKSRIESNNSSAAADELAQARADLAESHGELAAVTEQVAALTEQVTSLSKHAADADRDRASDANQVDLLSSEADALRIEVENLTAALREAAAESASLQQAAAVIEAEKQHLAAEFAASHEALLEEKASLAELLTAAECDLDQLRESVINDDQDKLQLTLSLQQAESACRDYQRQLDKLEQNAEGLAAQVAAGADAPQLRAELDAARAAAAEQIAAMELLRAELTALRQASVPQADLATARRDIQTAQTALAQLQSDVAAAQAETVAVRAATRSAAEYAELEQKCDLALADLQKLKRENGSLRDELAERPAASDQESPDLIAVRSERDALLGRVAELEAAAQAAHAATGDDDQERADLQRRFEMAVDDVRQLKQENARLKERTAAAEKSGAASGGGHAAPAGNDWAAQRARLMVMLENEQGDGPISSERSAERASVAATISATDQAIAAKNEELEELRAALATKQTDAGATAAATAAESLLSTDEVIAAERERLAKLSTEFEGKLRAAELEFSIERARLAREQAALRDRLFEIPAAGAKSAEAEVDPADPNKPRRRWSFALGLHDDSPGGKKK